MTNRRSFLGLGLVALGTALPGSAGSPPKPVQAKPAAAKPTSGKPPLQRARLPRRLAHDFRGHIEGVDGTLEVEGDEAAPACLDGPGDEIVTADEGELRSVEVART